MKEKTIRRIFYILVVVSFVIVTCIFLNVKELTEYEYEKEDVIEVEELIQKVYIIGNSTSTPRQELVLQDTIIEAKEHIIEMNLETQSQDVYFDYFAYETMYTEENTINLYGFSADGYIYEQQFFTKGNTALSVPLNKPGTYLICVNCKGREWYGIFRLILK